MLPSGSARWIRRRSGVDGGMAASLVLVTGASGYIGGRLVPELIDAGHRVRVLARTPAKLAGEPWLADVEVVQGDIGDGEAVAGALAGVTAAYYLVHSMGGAGDFAAHDRRAAAAFRTAADATVGLERIVYLGGLGDEDDAELSPHLSSRHEVGRELASGTAPVTELRAAVIIGSGSASFEMLRNLTDVLPVMITPVGCRPGASPSPSGTSCTGWSRPLPRPVPKGGSSRWAVPRWSPTRT